MAAGKTFRKSVKSERHFQFESLTFNTIGLLLAVSVREVRESFGSALKPICKRKGVDKSKKCRASPKAAMKAQSVQLSSQESCAGARDKRQTDAADRISARQARILNNRRAFVMHFTPFLLITCCAFSACFGDICAKSICESLANHYTTHLAHCQYEIRNFSKKVRGVGEGMIFQK